MRGPTVKAVFADIHEAAQTGLKEGDYAGSANSDTANEIEDIPLCANCLIGTKDDDPDTVVQKAIRRIDKTDGGLSRNRHQREAASAIGTRLGTVCRATYRTPELSEPPPTLLASSGLTTDGVVDRTRDNGCCMVPLDSTIYINIHDPIGLPAFKPSPTKPVPQWMQPPWMKVLPSQHKPPKAVEPRPRSILDDHFSDVSSASAEHPCPTEPYTVCPTTVQTRTRVVSLRERGDLADQEDDAGNLLTHNDILALRYSPITIPRGPKFSCVTSEPLKRPSSRIIHYNSGTTSSSPTTQDIVPFFFESPYPIPPRSTSVRSLEQPNSSTAAQSNEEPTEDYTPVRLNPQDRSPSPQTGVTFHVRSKMHRTPPPQSREYLDLYKPLQTSANVIKTGTASIAVAGRGRVRRIGNWEKKQPLVEISRRDSRSRPSTDIVAESSLVNQTLNDQTAKNRGSVINVRGDLLKRSSAHGDLWRLFGRGGGYEK